MLQRPMFSPDLRRTTFDDTREGGMGDGIAAMRMAGIHVSPHLSPAFVAKRRKGLGLQGLRPRPTEAY